MALFSKCLFFKLSIVAVYCGVSLDILVVYYLHALLNWFVSFIYTHITNIILINVLECALT